ncbi:hypothetical protein GCM10009624_36260 [Gordonia sinesedis]
MTVDLDGYHLIFLGEDVDRPVYELPRRTARIMFETVMQQKNSRKKYIRMLTSRSGLELDGSQESLRALERWLMENAEEDPDRPGFPTPEWYSIGWDAGLYVGDVLVDRYAKCAPKWELSTAGGKTEVNYHYPVLMVNDRPINTVGAMTQVPMDAVLKGIRSPDPGYFYFVDRLSSWLEEACS